MDFQSIALPTELPDRAGKNEALRLLSLANLVKDLVKEIAQNWRRAEPGFSEDRIDLDGLSSEKPVIPGQ
jgi:hypothetical protein